MKFCIIIFAVLVVVGYAKLVQREAARLHRGQVELKELNQTSAKLKTTIKPDGPPWTLMHDGNGHWTFTDDHGRIYLSEWYSREAAEVYMKRWRETVEAVERIKSRNYSPVTK